MIPRPAGSLRSFAKVGAAAVWLAAAPLSWVPLIYARAATLVALDAVPLAWLYTVGASLGLIAIAGAPFLRHAAARWPLVLVFLCSFAADYVASSIQGEPLSSHMIATFIQARAEVGHALATYGADIAAGFLIAAVLAPALLAAPGPGLSLGPWFLAIPALAVAIAALVIGHFAGRVEDFPSPISVPVQTYFAARETDVYLGPRDALSYTGPVNPRFEKIVFVLDESVRGDYLQLNNDAFDNTPFLVSARPRLANYGLATSYSNCSATARVALRSGARDSDFPDPGEQILRQPTLWQYARFAGYRTIYVDTWMPVRRMSSMLTYDELTYVDERTGVPLVPYAEADNRVADRIIAEIERPGRALLFVEKIGLHTPYGRNIPADAGYTPRPGVPRGALDAAQASDVRDYLIGIRWRVDRFFERLLPAIDRPGVLLVYTSDHGQSLYEGGYGASNCSGQNASKGEGIVPLIVFAGDEPVRRAFQASAAASLNRAAHSDIFPTLLWAMGFTPGDVSPPYGTGLLDVPAARARRFFVFSPFGSEMQWVSVD